jgi:hypothetical protein
LELDGDRNIEVTKSTKYPFQEEFKAFVTFESSWFAGAESKN